MKYNRFVTKKKEETDNWLLTYSDAVTLLLAFFVLMLAVSTIDQSKFEYVVEALSHGTTGNYSSPFDEVENKMLYVIKENNLQEQIQVERTAKGVNIDFSSAIFFNIGSEVLLDSAKVILAKIATILQEFEFKNYMIAVEGHTDNVPIRNTKIASNWELSALRASNTIRFLISEGVDSNHLKAIGYASTRPKVPNNDANGIPILSNQAKNRRVAIKIERES